MKKIRSIALESVPILIMIWLIPYVSSDEWLTVLYALFILGLLLLVRKKQDVTAFVLGLVIMTVCEYLFVNTGVEVFLRDSLWGVMPLWLPLLWGYGFVVIKRSVVILR